MKPLFTQTELNITKAYSKLPLECELCQSVFFRLKKDIQRSESNKRISCRYCSRNCSYLAKVTQVEVECKQCKKIFKKLANQHKKSKNHFCCRSCAATYNNTHKTKGIRRSKLEIWLENKLKIQFPKLIFKTNNFTIINLDIYIPYLKIAFEINGIVHYKPIYGLDKLTKIQKNDKRKIQLCNDKKISLYVIDASHLKKFNEVEAQQYLNIINKAISKHLKITTKCV
jgi:hypothetical protein